MPNNEILSLIANNPTLSQALKDLLLKQFDAPKNWALDLPETTSNELLGEFLRARIAGSNAVEDAFKEISKFKTPEPRIEKVNPGR